MYSALLVTAAEHDRRNMLRVHRRKLRDSTDPFGMPDVRFRELYRLDKTTATLLLQELSPFMKKGIRKTFIPPALRMCTALHFLASGSFHRDVGQDLAVSVSRSVVCRCVFEVADILEQKLMQKWIKFPNVEEYESIKQRFFEETGFPGVVGALDCTHIRIKRPQSEVENCYLNPKGYHSKNVQLICDFDLKILAGYARFGGAAHDSYIWEASRINALLQQRYEIDGGHSWLLGDSGYPLLPWLMTPYRSAVREDEKLFNTLHAKGRNCVERLNGVLKSTFRCLSVGLCTTPQRAGKIINACTTLHNFRQAHGLLATDVLQIQPNSNDMEITAEEFPEPLREATRLRDSLKQRFARR